MGKFLIYLGITFILAGLLFTVFEKILSSGIPILPGDIFIQKKNFTIYIPIVTSLLISIILTLILNLIGFIISKK